MKNESAWRPSRFLLKSGRIRTTRDKKELAVASRLTVHLATPYYAEWIPKVAKGSLLDLGCGKVPYYEVYRPHVEEIYCVDWSMSAHGNNHVDQVCDLSQPLELASESYDTILTSSVIEHVPEPQALFNEMARVLRPEGVILLNVPFLYGLHETPYDFYRYTEFALRRFCERSGLAIDFLQPLGGGPYVVGDLVAKMLTKAPLLGESLSGLWQDVLGALLSIPPGKSICRRTAAQMPSGYFVIARKAAGLPV